MKVTLPHRRGIDGLRAIAVTAVLLYHAEIGWLPGGFLGVDVFFVISGYLITSLLVAELAATGRISLRRFWARRARRLLPAVGALLVVVSVAALVAASDSVARLRGDVVAAIAYASNWWQIVRGESYFESFGRPPLLRHLWSLAVEEQLYVVVPLVLAWRGRRPSFRPRRAAVGTVVLAAASTVLFAALWDAGDPSRAWFGTDTRAAGLLIGVAIALWWPLDQQRRWTGSARRSLDLAGAAALVGLVALMATVGDLDRALPQVGYPLAVALAGVVVAVASHRSSALGWLLGIRPLVWLGTRSYAVYLWHWPVYVLTRPDVDVSLRGWQLHAVRFAVIGALAEVSWRVVEQPWRTGAVGRTWWSMRIEARRRVALVGAGVATALVAGLGVGLVSGVPPEPPALLATVARSPTTATTLARVPSTTTTTATTVAAPAPTTVPDPQVGPVLAVGDSVMLSARDALVRGSNNRMLVDAATGRQVDDGLDVLQRYRDAGTFGQVSAVVVHLGTNGPMSAPQFERLAMIVSGVPHVVVVNVRVRKPWEGESNASIGAGVPRNPAMHLADWYAASADPALLVDDGVHPTFEGARVYTYVVMQQLHGAPPPPPPTTTTAPPPPPSQPPPSTTTTTASPSPLPTLGP